MSCSNPSPNLLQALCRSCDTCSSTTTADQTRADFCDTIPALIMAKITELVTCGPGPVQIETVQYESSASALRALTELLRFVTEWCSSQDDGPVMETVWQDKCNEPPICCGWESTYCCMQRMLYGVCGCSR